MAPLTPFWAQPSHGDIQEVIINEAAFTSKSLSKISVPPFGLFAKMAFPPCTRASEPTYATVQMGRDEHLNLNSDLVYINHSCDPSLILDMSSLSMLAGPKGLAPGDELTFFYPSTEWMMAQGFDCFCGTAACKGWIGGAKDMTPAQLKGMWLNGYVREMVAERDAESNGKVNGTGKGGRDDAKVGGLEKSAAGAGRNGPTSRELSGEMGGDTVSV